MKEQGRAIEWGWIQVGEDRGIGIDVRVDRKQVIECLKADAQATLPANTRFELRQQVARNYGRTNGMAWYANDEMYGVPSDCWGKGEFPRYIEGGGYMLVGQFTTWAEPLPVANKADDL